MLNLLLELIFVAFPIVTLTVLSVAAAGGYFFGLTGAIAGSAVGLIVGFLIEVWLQRSLPMLSRAKWAGGFFAGLILVIGAVAVMTR